MPPNWRYFKPEEVEGLNEEFVAKLDMARQSAGIPFVITSGFRSPEKNQSLIGAVPNSAHLKGLAVDLRIGDDHELGRIVPALLASGINRIGVYVDNDFRPIHVHCDVDPDKPQDVIFIKKEGVYV